MSTPQTAAQINGPQTGQVEIAIGARDFSIHVRPVVTAFDPARTRAVLESLATRYHVTRINHGSHQSNLIRLVKHQGTIADLAGQEFWAFKQQFLLVELGWMAVLAMKWLPFSWEQVCEQIVAERQRQEELFRAGKFNFTCASPTVSNLFKLPVLAEEVGEVAQAILESDTAGLATELIQVATVCIGWLEALEAQHA